MTDAIKAPAHYTGGEIEPKDLILAGCFPHYVASAIEYIWRHRRKNGAEDLRKAAQCLRMHTEAFSTNGDYAQGCEVLESIGFYEAENVAAFVDASGDFYNVFDYCDMDKIAAVITQIEAAADAYEAEYGK